MKRDIWPKSNDEELMLERKDTILVVVVFAFLISFSIGVLFLTPPKTWGPQQRQSVESDDWNPLDPTRPEGYMTMRQMGLWP